ncbi:MAG: hypothetical protein ACLFWB_09145 [Armatimonadota bacterium]
MTGPVKQREVLDRLADVLVRRSLATPAIFILEAGKPLSFVASQSMLFFEPFLEAFFPAGDYHIVAEALEDRENVEWFIQRLEAAEEERREYRQQVKQ